MALTMVYGTILNEDGTPAIGVTINASLNAIEPVVTTSGMVLGSISTSTTNATGGWSLEVIPNDQITSPLNSSYTFQFESPAPAPTVQPFYAYASTITAHGASFSKTVVVPSASAINFDTLV